MSKKRPKRETGVVSAVGVGEFRVNLGFKPTDASFTVVGNSIEPVPASNNPNPPDSVTSSLVSCSTFFNPLYQLYFQWNVQGAKEIVWEVNG